MQGSYLLQLRCALAYRRSGREQGNPQLRRLHLVTRACLLLRPFAYDRRVFAASRPHGLVLS